MTQTPRPTGPKVAQEMYRSGEYTVATIAKTLGSAEPRSTTSSISGKSLAERRVPRPLVFP